MVWKGVGIMDEKARFLNRVKAGKESIAELCREFMISRETGYRLIRREKQEGVKAIIPMSRRPHNSPTELSGELTCEIVSVRIAKPSWGAKKIRKVLQMKGLKEPPSVRSINRILEKSGLVEKRRRKRQRAYYPEKVIRPRVCNDVWTIDIKGWWHTKDGKRCYPLTIRDEHSKYILDIAALASVTTETVKERLLLCFKRYGLPRYIRSDNGSPFCASQAVQGMSELSAWWISLGIIPNRIPLASPQYNGAHERMHRDMKRELQCNPAKNAKLQQTIFDLWRREFNDERPHEALEMQTPARVYRSSTIAMPVKVAAFNYADSMQTRKVGIRGEIWWRGCRFFLSGALIKKTIGIKKEQDDFYSIWYNDFFLGKTKFTRPFPLRGTSQGAAQNRKVSTMSWH